MKQRQIETYKRDFLEDAIATCFFRQPKFRAFMLQHADSGFYQCTDDQKAAITEYCESIYNANEKRNGVSALSKAFDWEALYSHLNQKDLAAVNSEVEELLKSSPDQLWRQRLTNSKQSFWLIIRAWMVHARRTLVFINDV